MEPVEVLWDGDGNDKQTEISTFLHPSGGDHCHSDSSRWLV